MRLEYKLNLESLNIQLPIILSKTAYKIQRQGASMLG